MIKFQLFFTISLLFISPSVSADEDIAADCEKSAADFGNGKGKDKIPSICYSHALNSAKPQAIKESLDGKYKVFAYQNIIFISRKSDETTKVSVIAGNSSSLKDISAVAFDDKNKEVAVLLASGKIYFFSTIITGNVSPRRVIHQSELLGASDLVINTISNEVIISNPQTGSLLFYSRLKNDDGKEEFKNLPLRRRIEIPNSKPEKIVLSPEANKLYVLSQGENKLRIYDLNDSASQLMPVEKELKETHESNSHYWLEEIAEND